MRSLSKTNNWRKSAAVLAVLFLTTGNILAGCAGSWGHVSPSREATELFHAYTILPDHRYYYSGPDEYPFAIIGIHNDYDLKSNLWKPVDLTSGQLNSWINWPTVRVGYDVNTYGAYLKGPNDESIGVWYGVRDWRAWGTVNLLDGKQVVVTTPDLERQQMPFRRIGKLE